MWTASAARPVSPLGPPSRPEPWGSVPRLSVPSNPKPDDPRPWRHPRPRPTPLRRALPTTLMNDPG